MGRDYVAITDNADPMNVVVYRRAPAVRGSRLVCSQPVFRQSAGSTDDSLIGTATSLVVENNYGYTGPAATTGGSTEPGVERVDLDRTEAAATRCGSRPSARPAWCPSSRWRTAWSTSTPRTPTPRATTRGT